MRPPGVFHGRLAGKAQSIGKCLGGETQSCHSWVSMGDWSPPCGQNIFTVTMKHEKQHKTTIVKKSVLNRRFKQWNSKNTTTSTAQYRSQRWGTWSPPRPMASGLPLIQKKNGVGLKLKMFGFFYKKIRLVPSKKFQHQCFESQRWPVGTRDWLRHQDGNGSGTGSRPKDVLNARLWVNFFFPPVFFFFFATLEWTSCLFLIRFLAFVVSTFGMNIPDVTVLRSARESVGTGGVLWNPPFGPELWYSSKNESFFGTCQRQIFV